MPCQKSRMNGIRSRRAELHSSAAGQGSVNLQSFSALAHKEALPHNNLPLWHGALARIS